MGKKTSKKLTFLFLLLLFAWKWVCGAGTPHRYLMEARWEPLAILTNLSFAPERLINVQSSKSMVLLNDGGKQPLSSTGSIESENVTEENIPSKRSEIFAYRPALCLNRFVTFDTLAGRASNSLPLKCVCGDLSWLADALHGRGAESQNAINIVFSEGATVCGISLASPWQQKADGRVTVAAFYVP